MSDPTDPVLTVADLSKSYAGREVLRDLSLAVAGGERVALLGHNGAGKSTLLKLILGLTRPGAGRIRVAGAAPGDAAARAATAYLPEQVAFHGALTGREQLEFFARLAGEPLRVVGPLLERVGLSAAADRRIGTWSKGMRQRLGLAQALLGRRRVALLDEPTSGLDPVSRHDLYAVVDEMAAQGTAVLTSSHALTELEARTDRIAILREGRLVANDTLSGLTARAALPIRIRLTAGPDGADALQAALGGSRINGHALDLTCPASEKMARLARITALGGAVADVEMTPPSLEDIYRHFATTEGAP
ncbi:ABC transporter ATP-binding protein [Maritimibacter sp. 55A14]|uniref:ABC transporter ATP-binding protein n=1 Tax=Maritimibacter sp. 55A14 TaxID=2174844 RepID=UPI000D6146A2|nr:ABC transporter ATP-binding protein [Maritimibacter sp. 55A14]PWE34344.1 ABC transporter ATP-binding protein [Maritimibacter sp. 55A14]